MDLVWLFILVLFAIAFSRFFYYLFLGKFQKDKEPDFSTMPGVTVMERKKQSWDEKHAKLIIFTIILILFGTFIYKTTQTDSTRINRHKILEGICMRLSYFDRYTPFNISKI